MIRRAGLLLFLALLAATNASPAAALILCISEDGCASLELAPPGSTRCVESRCDEAHAADGHACRDIPVLSAAQDLVRTGSTGDPIQHWAVLPNAAPSERVEAAPLAPDAAPLTPPPLRRLRTVVLTL